MSEIEDRVKKFWFISYKKGKPFEEWDIAKLEKEAKSNRNLSLFYIIVGLGLFLFGLWGNYSETFSVLDNWVIGFAVMMLMVSASLCKMLSCRCLARKDTLEFFELTMDGNKALLKGMEGLGRKVSKLTKDQKKALKN